MYEILMPIYKHYNSKMRVAGFMSGTGSVLKKIIEEENGYKVVVIFSDNFNSNACLIGKEHDIPVVIRDLNSYCSKRKTSRYNLNIRKDFDKETVKILECFHISVIAYAGYMSLVTSILIDNFIGVNVHPADLSILDNNGNRKYTGATAVGDAIREGETYIRSTSHLLTEEVDGGPILMISKPLRVTFKTFINPSNNINNDMINFNQSELKKVGDYVIFPLTLRYISEGRFSKDPDNNIYFNDQFMKNGIKLW